MSSFPLKRKSFPTVLREENVFLYLGSRRQWLSCTSYLSSIPATPLPTTVIIMNPSFLFPSLPVLSPCLKALPKCFSILLLFWAPILLQSKSKVKRNCSRHLAVTTRKTITWECLLKMKILITLQSCWVKIWWRGRGVRFLGNVWNSLA